MGGGSCGSHRWGHYRRRRRLHIGGAVAEGEGEGEEGEALCDGFHGDRCFFNHEEIDPR